MPFFIPNSLFFLAYQYLIASYGIIHCQISDYITTRAGALELEAPLRCVAGEGILIVHQLNKQTSSTHKLGTLVTG